jgi:addiction module HigA family antidote
MAMHNPPHPGEALREDILPELKLSTMDLAKQIGYSRRRLSTLLNGRSAIKARLAWRLELAV